MHDPLIAFLSGMMVCAQATPLIVFLNGMEVGVTPRQLRTRTARLVALY